MLIQIHAPDLEKEFCGENVSVLFASRALVIDGDIVQLPTNDPLVVRICQNESGR